METVNFSLRVWGITELVFNGLALLLYACSILPPMLLPAMAGGICSLVIFSIAFLPIVHCSQRRSTTLLLASLAIVFACFIPLYAFNYLMNGGLVLWKLHSKMYLAVLIAAFCGVTTILTNAQTLFRIQRNYHYHRTHRNS